MDEKNSASEASDAHVDPEPTLVWDLNQLDKLSCGSATSINSLPPSPRAYVCQTCQDSPTEPKATSKVSNVSDPFCSMSNMDSPTHQRIVVKLPSQSSKQSPSSRPRSTCIYDSRTKSVKLPPPPVKPKPKVLKMTCSVCATGLKNQIRNLFCQKSRYRPRLCRSRKCRRI